jgi:hypothetical protein
VDTLASRLEAMHANGEVIGHLSIRFSGDKLKAGWIEKGLLSKGIKGTLTDKENQNRYVIPLSTSMRSVIDRGLNGTGEAGIILLGEPGLRTEKFVMVFRNEHTDNELTRYISVFWINDSTPADIVNLFLKHELQLPISNTFDEPGIDYIEYVRDQTSTGNCNESLSIRIPSKWETTRTWIPDSLKDESGDQVIFKYQVSKITSALALLMSNWIKDVRESLKMSKIVGSSLFIRGEATEAFFWDGSRNIMTTSQFNSSSIETHAANILIPLWAESSETIPSVSPTKDDAPKKTEKPVETVPVSPPTIPPEYEELASRAQGLVRRIDIEDTYRRIERIEAIVSELEHMQQKEEEEEEKSSTSHPNLMESRIKEALESLEELTQRLSELEERLINVCRDLE